jgi:hypothetical protein
LDMHCDCPCENVGHPVSDKLWISAMTNEWL